MKESEALKAFIIALIKNSDNKELKISADVIDFVFEAYACCKNKEGVRNV